jgi:hypothetical protein
MACDDTKNEIGEIYMNDGSEVSYDGVTSTAFHVMCTKIPNTVFFLQKFTLPGLSIGSVSYATRVLDINEIGEKISYSPLTIEFLIDSKFKNYKEIVDWMNNITVGNRQKDEVSDLILTINNKRRIKFIDAWPISISGMQFAANAINTEYLTATLTLNYDWYEIT